MNRRSWLLGLLAFSLAGCASMQPKNVADVIAADPDLSTLNKLINDAGLTQTLIRCRSVHRVRAQQRRIQGSAGEDHG